MNEIIELYGNARVYDRMFSHDDDIPFYVQRVGSDCLEICCGTGRLLLELAAAGIEAHGLDYSAAMLDEARKKADARGLKVQLHQGDMRDFDLGRTFSTLLVAFNSIGHLYTIEDMQRHLNAVKKHMGARSKYLIEYFVPRFDLILENRRTLVTHYLDPDDGQKVFVWQQSHYDSATQIKHNHWYYEKGGKVERAEVFPIRMYFPQELDALLTLNGLRIVEKLGDYDGTAFGDGSPMQIITCELA